MSHHPSRRDFLKALAVAGGGLVIGVPLASCSSKPALREDAHWQPSAWLQLTPEGRIFFYLDRVEMGQGTLMGLTTLVAEELDIPPTRIEVMTAPVHTAFRNPEIGLQVTGGSTSMRLAWQPLREAAAEARIRLVLAAAEHWDVGANTVATRDGHVWHGQQSLPYKELVRRARRIRPPRQISLKDPASYRYIGQSATRLDAPMKVTGRGEFGIDAGRRVAHRAVIVRCPVAGGSVAQFDADKARSMKGVKAIVRLDHGVAVVADNTWRARQAAEQLNITWKNPALAEFSSDSLRTAFQQHLNSEDGRRAADKGQGLRGFRRTHTAIKATYEVPYLAHATLEPMNCTVQRRGDGYEIWAPTQAPDVLQTYVELKTGVSRDLITVHTTLLGGGFGRRLNQDFAVEAMQVALATGLDVQLVWSREDDTRHDFYRPAAMAELTAGFNRDKQLLAWAHKAVSPSIMTYTLKEMGSAVLPDWLPNRLVSAISQSGDTVYENLQIDPSTVEGAADLYYDVEHLAVDHIPYDPGLPVGFWRSVGHSYNAFFVESFIDEIAYHLGQDALALRRQHLAKQPRLARVLDTLAEVAPWGKPSKPGLAQGIAVHPSFQSYVAQLAEVSVQKGKIKVHRVVCVVDCGRAVNPDIVKAQMEGGIIFGLTAALYGDITLKDGAVQQSNFHDYPLLRLPDAPEIEVHIIPSDAHPSGVGEPAVPPIAPAVANAVFAASGHRLRKLPLALPGA